MAGEATPATAAGVDSRPRTRLVRVDQFIINSMLRRPPARPLPVFSDEVLYRLGTPGQRAVIASAAAAMKRVNDRDADILHQYRTKGYAEVEETLSDDDEVAAMPPVQEEEKKKKKEKNKKIKKKKEKEVVAAAMPVEKKKKKEEEKIRDRPTTTS